MRYIVLRAKAVLALPLVLLLAAGCGRQPPAIPTVEPSDDAGQRAAVSPVHFENHTERAGLAHYSPTFSVSAADIDGDLRDDLFIGNHGFLPRLFLNRGEVFEENTTAVPLERGRDRHVYTLVDFDNDGDRDFVYAGGGADGIGEGTPNGLFSNLLRESGELRFEDVSAESDISYQIWRSRAFLPLPSAQGDLVDLYLIALHKGREGTTNLHFRNRSTEDGIRFEADPTSTLHLRNETPGKDLFFDYDRDGDVDYLYIGFLQASLYRNDEGRFTRVETVLEQARQVDCATVADFDNDGYPDLYLGGISGHTYSDNIAANDEELHYVVHRQPEDGVDQFSFTTTSRAIRIDLEQHLPDKGQTLVEGSDIYLGGSMSSPERRVARIKRKDALWAPTDTDRQGTYIWYDPVSRLWQVLIRHPAETGAVSKGIIRGESLEVAGTENMETAERREISDYIFMNQRGEGWKLLATDLLDHDAWTQDVTAADFNNDGLVDIAGVRTHDEGRENGEPFLVLNRGGLNFEMSPIMQNSEDDIFRADLIAHGFFDDDGLPDLFHTHGYGLKPSHQGPYQLWLNRTVTRNGYLLLELEGTTANRDAIGAQVEVYGTDGELLGYRELGPGYGRSQDSHKLHFGLGSAPGPYRVEVRWPGSSGTQTFTLEEPGFHHLVQG